MANTANQDAVDTGQSDDIDTSTTEENLDTDATLGDDWDDASDEDTSSDDETEESNESDDDTAATESDDDLEEESDDDAESEEADSDDSDKESTEGRKPTREEQQRLNAEARDRRIAEREQKRLATKSQQQQDYIDQAVDASDQAVRQLQVDTYNNRVMMVTNSLHSSLNEAVNSPGLIELFRHENPEIRQEMIDAVDDFERLYVVKDQNDDPTEVKGDIHAFLQKRAERVQRLTGLGAKKQVQDKSNQKKRTVTPPARTPKKAKSDPMLEAFDEEVSSWSK